MKYFNLLIFVLLISKINIAQTDTLFSGKKKIPCKIVEIGDSEIKYKRAELPDGPTYVIERVKVSKYTLANGYTERVEMDELSLEAEHKEILGNREVIKVQPFTIALNYLSIAYEKVIRVGTNLDIELGYMNSSLTTTGGFVNRNVTGYSTNTPFSYGFYIKPGVKFFLGQDFSMKGLKYAHPLKGRYIRLDFAISYLNFTGVSRTIGYYPYPNYTTITTDINSVAYGGFINYGRQFILGNVLTLDYYIGIGFAAQSNNYSNPSFVNAGGPSYYYKDDRAKNIAWYGGFARNPDTGISGTLGLRVGYIIPSKKSPPLPKQSIQK